MPRRIRILYHTTKPTFSERLEKRARAILKQRDRNRQPSSTVTGLERQVALTLDQLAQTRTLHEDLRRSLLRQECYTDNELNDMEQRTPKYSPYRFPEREKLQRRLIKFEEERRRLALKEDEQLRGIHDRLLELVNRHAVLGDTRWSHDLTVRREG